MEEPTYNSCNKMNKPIRFYGLSSYHAIILFIFVTVSILFLLMRGLGFTLTLIMFGAECYAISIVATKFNRAYKNGTPDYLGALITFRNTPRKITDRNFLFRFLIKHTTEHGN